MIFAFLFYKELIHYHRCCSMRYAIRRQVVLLALSAVIVLYSLHIYLRVDSQLPPAISHLPVRERQTLLWHNIHSLLEQHAPKCPSPRRNGVAGAIRYNAVVGAPRPNLIVEQQKLQLPLQQAHDQFVRAIHTSGIYSAHTPSTSGIVSSAGRTYLPLFVISLRMLRRTGSTLPVELFMKDGSEYEPRICDEVLPRYNARCVVLSDIMQDSQQGASAVNIEHYQLKVFAVLLSSFENVIWMDSDGFPLYAPDMLLRREPFASTGLVTWPDYWASTTSPLYYNISRQAVPPMTTRQSSETGVFLISKRIHFSTLLLAAYYNYYGPSHYFTLLSQGAPGEGDRETFIQAAAALHRPFHTVSEPVTPIGHRKDDGDISGSAMVQSDPEEDYHLTRQGKWRVRDPSVAKVPRAFFVHAHYPKFNPAENLFGHKWETAPTLNPDGSDGRAWVVPTDTLKRFGFDAEKAYWEEIKWVSCNMEHVFRTWREKSGLCHRVAEYWNNVFEDPTAPVIKFAS